jgi:hypothetical protein
LLQDLQPLPPRAEAEGPVPVVEDQTAIGSSIPYKKTFIYSVRFCRFFPSI